MRHTTWGPADIRAASAGSPFVAEATFNPAVPVGSFFRATVTYDITNTSCPSDIWFVMRIADSPNYVNTFPVAVKLFTVGDAVSNGSFEIDIPAAVIDPLSGTWEADLGLFNSSTPAGAPTLGGSNIYGTLSIRAARPARNWLAHPEDWVYYDTADPVDTDADGNMALRVVDPPVEIVGLSYTGDYHVGDSLDGYVYVISGTDRELYLGFYSNPFGLMATVTRDTIPNEYDTPNNLGGFSIGSFVLESWETNYTFDLTFALDTSNTPHDVDASGGTYVLGFLPSGPPPPSGFWTNLLGVTQ